jgi:lipoate-protein ligase A
MIPLRVGGIAVSTSAAGIGLQSEIYPQHPINLQTRAEQSGSTLADSPERNFENFDASAKSRAKNVNEDELRPDIAQFGAAEREAAPAAMRALVRKP